MHRPVRHGTGKAARECTAILILPFLLSGVAVVASSLIALAAKMAVVAAVVVVAARVAERTRPAFGALIATLPLSLGPTYILLALDHDAVFLQHAALNSVASAATTVVFMVVMALMVVRTTMLPALAAAFVGWALAAWLVYALPWTLGRAGLFAGLVLMVAHVILRPFGGYRPAGPPIRRWWDVPVRALMVAALVGAVTGLSSLLGPQGVGTLANFPIIMSSMSIIMAQRQGPRASAAFLANATLGMAGVTVALAVMVVVMVPLGVPVTLFVGLGVCLVWNATLFVWTRR